MARRKGNCVMEQDEYDATVFPLVVGAVDAEGVWDLREVVGTCFIVQRTAVTCWHQVRDSLARGLSTGIALENPATGRHHLVPVSFTRSRLGHDLAVGRVPPGVPSPPVYVDGLGLPSDGEDVYSYGFPLHELRRDDDGRIIFTVTRRMLRGYVVRGAADLDLGLGLPPALALELDMPAPPGLSGAPLFSRLTHQDGRLRIVGVVQGQRTITQADSATTFSMAYAGPLLADALDNL